MNPSLTPQEVEQRRTALSRAFARHGVTRCAIMASTFRSGSTWIARIMDRHGLVGIRHERLRQLDAQDAPDQRLDTLLATQKGPVFASRLMWVQRNRLAHMLRLPRAQSAAFAAQFPDAAWLLLRRRDVYAQGISYWRAKVTNRWHAPAARDDDEPQIAYDFPAIDACVRELVLQDQLWGEFFALAGIVPTTVWYEDFLADRTLLDGYVGQFGLTLHDTESDMKILGDALSRRYRDRYLDELFRRSKGLDETVKAAGA